MRAVRLHRTGAPDVLRVEEVPDPSPAPGEVLVRMEAIGLNYAEVLSRKGLYGWAPARPYILGMEGAGTVAALGSGVKGPPVGERVIVGMKAGAYAELVCVPAGRTFPAPDDFSIEECAAFAVNYLTAWVALMEMARLRPTDRVAVTAAGGGVGTAAVQIAAAFGCEVLALAGAPAKLELATRLGAHSGLSYREEGFPARLAAAVAPEGLDVVLETVGGDVFRACDAALAPFGRIVAAGYASLDYSPWKPWSWWRAWRDRPHMRLEPMFKGSKGLLATHLGYLPSAGGRVQELVGRLAEYVRAHGIRPVVGHVLDLQDVAAAHELLESRRSLGKVVMRV